MILSSSGRINGRNYTPLPIAKREHVARHLGMVLELKQVVST